MLESFVRPTLEYASLYDMDIQLRVLIMIHQRKFNYMSRIVTGLPIIASKYSLYFKAGCIGSNHAKDIKLN